MKELLLLSALTLSLSSYGQGFQIGVQSGADYKMIDDVYSTFQTSPTRFSANKGLYARHETKNGWAFEVNASHTQFNYANSPIDWDCFWVSETDNIAGRSYTDRAVHNKLDIITINTVAQHRVTDKKSLFSDYIGLNAGITRVYQKETTDYTFSDDPTGKIYSKSSYDHNTDIHMGLINTVSLMLGKHFVIRNTLSVYANPFKLFSPYPYRPAYSANTTFQCSFGIGYLFK
jgi:hypothetical protein